MNEEELREGYRLAVKELIRYGFRITTMESCTSGYIASLITDTEGASEIFKGAFVTYSNEAKILCGVPEKIIREYSVYSEETAKAMADACRNAFSADIGIGITGTFGNPDPCNMEFSVPGQVWFAVSFKDRTETCFKELPEEHSRHRYKETAAAYVLTVLREVIRQLSSAEKL